MKRSIWIHSLLLLGLLGFSWKLSKPDDIKVGSTGVVVYSIAHKNLHGLTYKTDKHLLDITVEPLSQDRYYGWATLKSTNEVTRPIASESNLLESTPGSGEPTEVETETVIEELEHQFKAGKGLDNLLQAVTPLKAKRRIAKKATEDQLIEWGFLKKPADGAGPTEPAHIGVLTLITSSGKQVLEIGGSPFANRRTAFPDRYVHDVDTQAVYLVDGSVFGELKSINTPRIQHSRLARSLFDKSLWGPKESGFKSIQANNSEKTLTMTHKNREDRAAHTWVPSTAKGDPAILLAWVKKLFSPDFLAQSYVQKDEEPSQVDEQLAFVADTDVGEVTLKVYKGTSPDGTILWYAKGSHTRQWVTLKGTAALDIVSEFEDFVE